MGFLRKDSRDNISLGEQLYLTVHANRAAELVDKEALFDFKKGSKPKKINPVLICNFNGFTKKTKRKLITNNPTWDQVLSFPLRYYDKGLCVTFSVWDKHRSYKTYLGELRVDLNEVFYQSDDSGKKFTPKSDLKWYKLYSNKYHKSFVTGSLLLSFALEVKQKKRKFMKKAETLDDIQVNENTNVKLKLEPPTRQPSSNSPEAKKDMFNRFDDMNVSETDLSAVNVTDIRKEQLFKDWYNALIFSGSDSNYLLVNDEGFYSDSGDATDVLLSDAADIESNSISEKESLKDKNLDSSSTQQPRNMLHRKFLESFDSQKNEFPGSEVSSVSDMSITSTDFTDNDSDASSLAFMAADNEMTDLNDKSSESHTNDRLSDLPVPVKKERRSFRRPSRSKSRARKKLMNKFEIKNRQVDGVLFLEIVSCSNLPVRRRLGGLGRFDMDPFVVVTFGKKTVRTSWKRHNLNPVFNERLAFEVLNNEKNFDVHFLILDKDRFSLHDDVANVSIPLEDLTKAATANSKNHYSSVSELGLSSADSMNLNDEFTDSDVPTNENITMVDDKNLVESVQKKLIRKKLIMKQSDTSKFKTMDLALKLEDDKYAEERKPKLKIRVRYETYDNLRRNFWIRLLDQYSLHDESDSSSSNNNVSNSGNVLKCYDYIELISLLDALGCEDSDQVVNKFFETHGKLPWGGDTLTIDQICQSLEDYICSEADTNNRLFEIEKCPNCLNKKLINKRDLDIVTHFAICGSKDWSIVNKLLVSSYVTPQLASKRWFTKVLIKISYGKYQLGSNSANILVQERTTGIILEEKMGVYVRLGIRLLYKGLDSAKKSKIRSLLKRLSVKQGKKFDLTDTRNDIASFVKFHKLDLSDCLEPDISKYNTFNEFFYRKLKPGARPVEAEENPNIASSPADCRCVAFNSVNKATDLWIKGRNFTVAKLFNGNFDNLETTNIYKHDKCALGIFRLAPQDYHRFHSPVSGTIQDIKFIDGEYYTVNPMAIRSELDVFGENVRALISIKTESFGTVVMIPIGAMMVGSIILTKEIGDSIKRGDEMGYFKFGGSTVVLLFEQDKFVFDSDLTNNSNSCIETLVRVGQSIGHLPNTPEFKRTRIDFIKLSKASRKSLIRVITGGDLSDSKELKSWESENIRITPNDVNSLLEEQENDNYEDDFSEEESSK